MRRSWLVVAALAVLLWIFGIPGCSPKFGCATPGASSSDDTNCPSSIESAAADPAWFADQLRKIPRKGQKTTGLFYDEDGEGRKFTSGVGVVVINNADGPCGVDPQGPFTCAVAVRAILPEGSTLVVWSPRDPTKSVEIHGGRSDG